MTDDSKKELRDAARAAMLAAELAELTLKRYLKLREQFKGDIAAPITEAAEQAAVNIQKYLEMQRLHPEAPVVGIQSDEEED